MHCLEALEHFVSLFFDIGGEIFDIAVILIAEDELRHSLVGVVSCGVAHGCHCASRSADRVGGCGVELLNVLDEHAFVCVSHGGEVLVEYLDGVILLTVEAGYVHKEIELSLVSALDGRDGEEE